MKIAKLIALLALTTTQATEAQEQDVCYALAMRVGGSKGAYEAGALWGIYYALKDLGQQAKMAYDSISGVSVGSINTFFLSFFPKGQEE